MGGFCIHRLSPFSTLYRALKSKKVRCGLKCMLSPEKLAEMSAQIAFDLLQSMQVSRILICILLTSSAATELSMWAMNSYHWGENCHSIFCVISLMMPRCLLRAWNIKSVMIMMMITMAAMMIIIKSTSSIFVVVIFILWSAAFICSEYKMANSIFNKSKNPAEGCTLCIQAVYQQHEAKPLQQPIAKRAVHWEEDIKEQEATVEE